MSRQASRSRHRSGVQHGVLAVVVSLVVAGCAGAPAPDPPDADTALRSRVEAALAAARDVDADRIAVDVRSGVVWLTGQVASGTEQQSAGAIVRAVPGVGDVRFDLAVVAAGP